MENMASGTIAPRPGLFVVPSRISRPDIVTVELFTKWYEEVHIPDLLGLQPRVASATRYALAETATGDGPQPFPFLALYDIADLAWVHDTEKCELYKLPLHNEMVPVESHFIFDVADFDMRFYETVLRKGSVDGVAKHVVTVPLDGPLDGDVDADSLLSKSLQGLQGPAPARSSLYKLDLAPPLPAEPKPEGNVQRMPLSKYLAIHEFTAPVTLTNDKSPGAFQFDLLRSW